MKTNTHPLLAAIGLAAGLSLFFTGCAKTQDADTTADAMTPNASSSVISATTESWENLKNYSYDQRSDFAEKANEYAEQIDRQVQIAKGDASNRLAEARDELRTAANEVSNATAESWEATKERVGEAWQKAHSAAVQAAE